MDEVIELIDEDMPAEVVEETSYLKDLGYIIERYEE